MENGLPGNIPINSCFSFCAPEATPYLPPRVCPLLSAHTLCCCQVDLMFGIGSQAVAAEPPPPRDGGLDERGNSGGSGGNAGGPAGARSRAESTASASSASVAAQGAGLGQVYSWVCVGMGGRGGGRREERKEGREGRKRGGREGRREKEEGIACRQDRNIVFFLKTPFVASACVPVCFFPRRQLDGVPTASISLGFLFSVSPRTSEKVIQPYDYLPTCPQNESAAA